MKRVFHNYKKWEEVDYNFYASAPVSKMEKYAHLVLSVLANKKECEKQMRRVVKEWPNSCEHNLTNPSLNKIAWLGQSSCALSNKVPQDATMKIWSLLSDEEKTTANAIAKKIIKEWESKNED
jgi:hypothetical protein